MQDRIQFPGSSAGVNMWNNNQLSMLDIITLISFVIGVANYDETIDQTQLQNILNSVVSDIHSHLQEQDKKLDEITKILYGKED